MPGVVGVAARVCVSVCVARCIWVVMMAACMLVVPAVVIGVRHAVVERVTMSGGRCAEVQREDERENAMLCDRRTREEVVVCEEHAQDHIMWIIRIGLECYSPLFHAQCDAHSYPPYMRDPPSRSERRMAHTRCGQDSRTRA